MRATDNVSVEAHSRPSNEPLQANTQASSSESLVGEPRDSSTSPESDAHGSTTHKKTPLDGPIHPEHTVKKQYRREELEKAFGINGQQIDAIYAFLHERLALHPKIDGKRINNLARKQKFKLVIQELEQEFPNVFLQNQKCTCFAEFVRDVKRKMALNVNTVRRRRLKRRVLRRDDDKEADEGEEYTKRDGEEEDHLRSRPTSDSGCAGVDILVRGILDKQLVVIRTKDLAPDTEQRINIDVDDLRYTEFVTRIEQKLSYNPCIHVLTATVKGGDQAGVVTVDNEEDWRNVVYMYTKYHRPNQECIFHMAQKRIGSPVSAESSCSLGIGSGDEQSVIRPIFKYHSGPSNEQQRRPRNRNALGGTQNASHVSSVGRSPRGKR